MTFNLNVTDWTIVEDFTDDKAFRITHFDPQIAIYPSALRYTFFVVGTTNVELK